MPLVVEQFAMVRSRVVEFLSFYVFAWMVLAVATNRTNNDAAQVNNRVSIINSSLVDTPDPDPVQANMRRPTPLDQRAGQMQKMNRDKIMKLITLDKNLVDLRGGKKTNDACAKKALDKYGNRAGLIKQIDCCIASYACECIGAGCSIDPSCKQYNLKKECPSLKSRKNLITILVCVLAAIVVLLVLCVILCVACKKLPGDGDVKITRRPHLKPRSKRSGRRSSRSRSRGSKSRSGSGSTAASSASGSGASSNSGSD